MIDQIYDNIDVFDATVANWQGVLLQSLGQRETLRMVPLQNILSLMEQQGAKTVICEKEYIDADFLVHISIHILTPPCLCLLAQPSL